MTILTYKLLLGVFGSSFIAIFSYVYQLLTKSGVFALIMIGTLVCGFGSWPTWVLLILLFGSSSCISFFKKVAALDGKDTISKKDAQRDGWQILANGLPAVVSLVLYYYTDNLLFIIGYVSAIAGATADTWASEIGILSTSPPLSILTFKPIPSGLSGGVSLLGTFASILGSLMISITFWFLHGPNITFTTNLVFVPVVCGFAHSLIDSFLGAAFQVKYRCSICDQVTERNVHHQQPTTKITGIFWLNNDWVNFISGCFTVLLSWLLMSL